MKKKSVLDNISKNYITIFPSTLVAGTTIASGITCERQAVLNSRFKTDGQNEVMLVGTLTHELFEWSVTNKSKFSWHLTSTTSQLVIEYNTTFAICRLLSG